MQNVRKNFNILPQEVAHRIYFDQQTFNHARYAIVKCSFQRNQRNVIVPIAPSFRQILQKTFASEELEDELMLH